MKAGTINAVSGARSDVARAIASARDGDTVFIPAGTTTWANALITTAGSRSLTIQGAGTEQTIIYDNVPKAGGGNQSVFWSFNLTAGKSFRLTGITVRGQAQDAQNYNNGTLVFSGGSHAVRIDHVNFIQPGTGCMIFNGDIWGVVDHCYFDLTGFHQGVQIHHGNWNGDTGGWGDGSFEDQLHLGTEKAIYIEDCAFQGSGTPGAGAIDGTFGGRFVFRHNTVTADQVGMHGTEGFRGRGLRSFEIYENTFTSPNGIFFVGCYIRSGTGVIFNNAFNGDGGGTGYRYGIDLVIYRATTTAGRSCSGNNFGAPWGMATGSNPWDGNTGVRGYPVLDQVGRGACADRVRGDNPINQTTGTASWPHNASEPVYEWGNTIQSIRGETNQLLTVQCTDELLQQGRDYFRATEMPAYTPYAYPHPLTKGLPPSEQRTRNATGNLQHDAHKNRRPWGGKTPERKQAKKGTNQLPEGQENVDN